MIPVAILAGGKGTRLAEETDVRPKPMVEIGGIPILLHIMKIYAHYGYKDFYVAAGYKKEYIEDFFIRTTIPSELLGSEARVRVCDTGEDTQIAGRIRKILEITKCTTMVTYGDGLANIDISELVYFHKRQGRLATITAVNPPARFGKIHFGMDGVTVEKFDEKPVSETHDYINGGFMVLEPEILNLGEFRDDEIFERVYLPKLARMRELAGYYHPGWWQCMDTLREKQMLNELWEKGDAPWKVWK